MSRMGPLGIDVALVGGEIGKLVFADRMAGSAEQFRTDFIVVGGGAGNWNSGQHHPIG